MTSVTALDGGSLLVWGTIARRAGLGPARRKAQAYLQPAWCESAILSCFLGPGLKSVWEGWTRRRVPVHADRRSPARLWMPQRNLVWCSPLTQFPSFTDRVKRQITVARCSRATCWRWLGRMPGKPDTASGGVLLTLPRAVLPLADRHVLAQAARAVHA